MIYIVSLAFMAVSIVIMALQFKNTKPEYGIYMGLAGVMVIAAFSLGRLSEIIDSINVIKQYTGTGQYMSLIIKVTGITYVSELASDICKEAGYGTIAGQILIFGKLSVVALCIPVFETLFKIIIGF